MSHRPIHVKKLNLLRKALRRRPLEAHIDLIQWLKDRRHADTTGQAEKLILAGRVRADSHTLGVTTVKAMEKGKVVDKKVVQPRVPARLRGKIYVKAAA